MVIKVMYRNTERGGFERAGGVMSGLREGTDGGKWPRDLPEFLGFVLALDLG